MNESRYMIRFDGFPFPLWSQPIQFNLLDARDIVGVLFDRGARPDDVQVIDTRTGREVLLSL